MLYFLLLEVFSAVAITVSPSAAFVSRGSSGSLDGRTVQSDPYRVSGPNNHRHKRQLYGSHGGIPTTTSPYNRGHLNLFGFPFRFRGLDPPQSGLKDTYLRSTRTQPQYSRTHLFRPDQTSFDPTHPSHNFIPYSGLSTPSFDSFATSSSNYDKISGADLIAGDFKPDYMTDTRYKEQTDNPYERQNLQLTFLGFLPQSLLTNTPRSFENRGSSYKPKSTVGNQTPFYPLKLDYEYPNSDINGLPSVLVSPYRIKPDLPDQGVFGNYRPINDEFSRPIVFPSQYFASSYAPQGSNSKLLFSTSIPDQNSSPKKYSDSPSQANMFKYSTPLKTPCKFEEELSQREENGYYLFDVQPLYKM